MVLLKIEKALYDNFSIREMEELLDRGSVPQNLTRRGGINA